MFSAKKAFKNDGLLRIYLIYAIILVLAGIALVFFYGKDPLIYVWFFIGGIIGIVLLFLRLSYLKKFIANEVENVVALVKKTFYYRGTKVVKLEYVYKEQNHKRTILLNYTGDTKMIEKESEISLILNPEKPSRVLISELYLN